MEPELAEISAETVGATEKVRNRNYPSWLTAAGIWALGALSGCSMQEAKYNLGHITLGLLLTVTTGWASHRFLESDGGGVAIDICITGLLYYGAFHSSDSSMTALALGATIGTLGSIWKAVEAHDKNWQPPRKQ